MAKKEAPKGQAPKGAKKEREVNESMPQERAEIIAWLKKVKFRRSLFGGVDERNVWKKIQELDALYAKALEAERVRYNTLLEVNGKEAPQEPSEEDPPEEKGGDPSE